LYAAVSNALDPEGEDYSNGACYWDGNDLKTNRLKHPHYAAGYYVNPEDDVLGLGVYADNPQYHITEEGREYTYRFISVAGYGKTIFFKATPEFLFAKRSLQCH
jgi:hypothetical protein